MEKTIKIGDKNYVLKELKYKDMSGIDGADKKEAAKKLMQMSTELTEEQYDNLSLREGIALQKAINELNGLDDFQQPPTQN